MKGYWALLALTGSIIGTLATGALAHADAPDGQRRSVRVQFSQDELLASAGLARVYSRLNNAAHEVCRYYDSRELARKPQFERCAAASLARAVAQIHDPGLSAYLEHRSGSTPAPAAVAGSAAAMR